MMNEYLKMSVSIKWKQVLLLTSIYQFQIIKTYKMGFGNSDFDRQFSNYKYR